MWNKIEINTKLVNIKIKSIRRCFLHFLFLLGRRSAKTRSWWRNSPSCNLDSTTKMKWNWQTCFKLSSNHTKHLNRCTYIDDRFAVWIGVPGCLVHLERAFRRHLANPPWHFALNKRAISHRASNVNNEHMCVILVLSSQLYLASL